MTARLQVLYLPTNPDDPRARYAFVVDHAGDLSPEDREALSAFATSAGGQGCVVVSGVLDLDQGEDDDEETTEALQEVLREAMAVPEMPQPAQPQKPKLPPPNTTEGKLARVWGGKPTTDIEDPR